MVLVLKQKSSETPHKQVEKIFMKKKRAEKKHEWDKFFGKLRSKIDPVSFQRQLRDE